jgi:hypothetical protein
MDEGTASCKNEKPQDAILTRSLFFNLNFCAGSRAVRSVGEQTSICPPSVDEKLRRLVKKGSSRSIVSLCEGFSEMLQGEPRTSSKSTSM